MKVYHGSYIKIEKIDLAKCLPQKDFGQGFYVTKFKHRNVSMKMRHRSKKIRVFF